MCFSASIIIPFFRSKDSTCVFFCVFFGDRRWHIQWSSFSKHPMQRKHSHPDSRFLQCLSICTHPNQYSSCKTYFTEMALSRGVKKLKEKDLSIIHWYRWLLWCEGVLMERDVPCVSLRFVMLLSSSSLWLNTITGVESVNHCEYWSVGSESITGLFICASF